MQLFNTLGCRAGAAPWLRFFAPADDDLGGGSGGDGGDQLGFPTETPLEQMTPEQQIAYWKHNSRKHEKAAKARADYDQLKADSDELQRLKQENQSEHEKELAAARDDARREGENIGAARYLLDAIKGRFQALTAKNEAETTAIFAHVDPATFVLADGSIDQDALKTYAETFVTKDPGGNEDPVKKALERQRQAGGGQGGSISEIRKARREKLLPTSN
ncbi:MAG: hypothetical protein J0H96_11875 [Microbacterium ginsengisoli]|jgi:hypothetical protein|nr:hypothetical protein [Microbacterium ginsengisoli]